MEDTLGVWKMIKLLHPEMTNIMIIIIPILTLLYIYVYSRRRTLLKLLNQRDNILWHIIQASKIASIILLLLASTLPVSVQTIQFTVHGNPEETEIKRVMYNITALHVLLIDESKSMQYTDGTNITRFVRALNFTYRYMNYLSPKDKLLIIGFSEYPRKICLGNITFCHPKLLELSPDKRYSDLSAALAYAYSYVTASQYPAIIVIVSDGAYNEGGDPYDEIVSINKSGYPVLFVRIGLDKRADQLVEELTASNIYVININQFTEKLLNKLTEDAARQMRLEAFISKKLLEVKVSKEVVYPYPTIYLLVASLVLFLASRIEGY